MKLCIVALITTIVAALTQAATLPLKQCEVTELILAHRGECPAIPQETCVDFCTGENIDTIDRCTFASHCCWIENECILNEIPQFSIEDEREESTSERSHNLRRTKRQAGGRMQGSIENNGYGTIFSGRVNQNIGRNGNAYLAGKYHYPSDAWQASAGYGHNYFGYARQVKAYSVASRYVVNTTLSPGIDCEAVTFEYQFESRESNSTTPNQKTLRNKGKVSFSGSTDSFGTHGLRTRYSTRAFGGRLGASVNANSLGGRGASVDYTKTFRGGSFGASANTDSFGMHGLRAAYSTRALGGQLGASLNANSRGGSGASVGYTKTFKGGSLRAGASIQRDRWGNSNPTFGIQFSKQFGR